MTWEFWVCWLLGVAIHVLLRAGYAIRSKVNPVKSRWDFLKQNWDTVAVRTFLSGLIFAYGLRNPDALDKLVTLVAEHFNISNFDFSITFSNVTSAGFGFFSDTVLDSVQSFVASSPKLSWLNNVLRGQIPGYDPTVVDLWSYQTNH